jgi:hypothetical protein
MFDFQLEVDHNERCSPSGFRSNTVVIGHTQQSRARAPGGRSRRQLMAANSRAGIDGARGALATPPSPAPLATEQICTCYKGHHYHRLSPVLQRQYVYWFCTLFHCSYARPRPAWTRWGELSPSYYHEGIEFLICIGSSDDDGSGGRSRRDGAICGNLPGMGPTV